MIKPTKQARVEARIDSRLKSQVNAVLRKLDMSESEAIRLFYRQIALNKGIPFQIKIPNKETIDAFNEAKKGNLKSYKNFDELLKDNGLR